MCYSVHVYSRMVCSCSTVYMYILGWLVVVVQELQLLQQYKILSLVRYKLQHLLNLVMSRLLGRFAPIFYLNCERVLFDYILKQRRRKFCEFYKKKSQLFYLIALIDVRNLASLCWGNNRSVNW